ncbi:MAG: formylglycine-generating enzyme family protein [Alphaproteobacteria bacterium]
MPNPPAARPDWASEAGEDRFGRWADIRLGNARQRLRWIESGLFWMGSPEDEPERSDHEGPRHQVTLTSGFWLFDTPVTQALWQAVMGDNPSWFTGADRPVEQVSWDDVQQFLERINGRMPGLDLALPTEAQWEYACRAGTTTATYAGPMEILSSDTAPVLDAIAWYRGNSGDGTHPVGQKAPNPWGLYDMLGNVWEWCADDKRPYGPGPATDPAGPHSRAERSSSRALRGGAWSNHARFVRAAIRYAGTPDSRIGIIGFRCARGRP